MRRDIETDFLVVGSGAGGSVVAYHLARAGERVLLLERGAFVRPSDMSADELEMLPKLYKDGGGQTNTRADMFILQGQCVGGSTVLTNAVCFRMPDEVRRSFAAEGFEIPAEDLEESYRRVEEVLNVHPLEDELMNPAAYRIADGLRGIGLRPGRFRKAMLRCVGCGYCNMGCRFGRKLDASMTWVPMAQSRGAELLTGAEAVRIETRRGAVEGVICRDLRDGRIFRIRARRYVLSGGAINTPELLLRSGILSDRVGRRTSFNAGAIVFAEYPEPVDGFLGDQMCVYHLGEGYAIEQVQNPPMSFAATLPGWYDRHAGIMSRYRWLAAAGVIVPTAPVGRVFLGLGHRLLRPLFDHADIEFDLPPDDVASLRYGFKQIARAFLASGATRVILPTARPFEIRESGEVALLDERIRSQQDLVGFGSSHPHGGACCGDDPSRHVVGPDFRVRGLGNLFVCDASLFPGSVRVNPMLTIMAVADHAVRSIGGFRPRGPVEDGPVYEARRRLAPVR